MYNTPNKQLNEEKSRVILFIKCQYKLIHECLSSLFQTPECFISIYFIAIISGMFQSSSFQKKKKTIMKTSGMTKSDLIIKNYKHLFAGNIQKLMCYGKQDKVIVVDYCCSYQI